MVDAAYTAVHDARKVAGLDAAVYTAFRTGIHTLADAMLHPREASLGTKWAHYTQVKTSSARASLDAPCLVPSLRARVHAPLLMVSSLRPPFRVMDRPSIGSETLALIWRGITPGTIPYPTWCT